MSGIMIRVTPLLSPGHRKICKTERDENESFERVKVKLFPCIMRIYYTVKTRLYLMPYKRLLYLLIFDYTQEHRL